MRIGLNGTPYDSLASGARDRFLYLYGEAARRGGGNSWFMYSPRDLSLVPHFGGPLAGSCRTPMSPDRPLARFLRSSGWFRRRLPRDGIDLFVTDHYPVIERPGLSTLLTIHDLRSLVLPGSGSVLRRAWFRRRFAAVAARATVVVTVSETIRREVLERLALPEEKVKVVPNGVSQGFRRVPEEGVVAYRRRAGLPSDYLLHVGVLTPRKNLRVLLRALARRPDLPPLVLTGRGGPEERPLRAIAVELGVADRLQILGYTEESDLPALCSGATAIVMPSRYEGFGIPILQAFAVRTPVVCSTAGALREVAGDAALFAEPDDDSAWADAIGRLLTDTDLRDRLTTAGRRRADEFTWSAAADRFLRVVKEVSSAPVARR